MSTGIGKFFDTPSRREVFDYTYDGIMRSLEHSLERLGLDHVEILFVHDVDVFTHKSVAARDAHVETLMAGGYRALVKLRDQGVIKAFGAGVNEWEVAEDPHPARRLRRLSSRRPLYPPRAGGIGEFCCRCASAAASASSWAGPTIPASWRPGRCPAPGTDYDPAPAAIVDRVAAIQRVCAAQGVGLSEAACASRSFHPSVVSIIPGASSPDEVARNGRALAAAIPARLWQELKSQGLLRGDAPVGP